jgi:tRNA pseudouridine38-40 synthase
VKRPRPNAFRLGRARDYPTPRRLRLTVAYDGTDFAGWQIQPDGPSIQGELERVLRELTGETVRVQGSGRTDAGVHARAQVAHTDLRRRVEMGKLRIGLNARLPPDVRVTAIRRARPDFHARFGATGKEYRYFIWNGPIVPPFVRRYRAPVARPLDVEAMRRAAAALVGRQDFAAFSANPNREVDGTVRHLRELRVGRRGPEVTIVARGDGFLYKMVRSLAGFLIRVGTGELPPEAAAEILASRIRTARVPTAPAAGLFLWKVDYGPQRPPPGG